MASKVPLSWMGKTNIVQTIKIAANNNKEILEANIDTTWFGGDFDKGLLYQCLGKPGNYAFIGKGALGLPVMMDKEKIHSKIFVQTDEEWYKYVPGEGLMSDKVDQWNKSLPPRQPDTIILRIIAHWNGRTSDYKPAAEAYDGEVERRDGPTPLQTINLKTTGNTRTKTAEIFEKQDNPPSKVKDGSLVAASAIKSRTPAAKHSNALIFRLRAWLPCLGRAK